MRLVEAIIAPVKLEDVKDRLCLIGVRGMTVADVKGFGQTGGRTEAYRGESYRALFVDKVRLQVVVTDDMVDAVINAITLITRTGNAGDGKIFVSPVDEVIRIRTGESGTDAL